MPTAVFVASREKMLVGYEAERWQAREPLAFFEHFKRKLGSQERFLVQGESLSPEDLAAAVLKYIRSAAEREYNNEAAITEAVITVPTTYAEGGERWQAMERAGRMAGFQSVTLVREPNAAGIYMDYLLKRANEQAVIGDGAKSERHAKVVRVVGLNLPDESQSARRTYLTPVAALPAGLWQQFDQVPYIRSERDPLRSDRV